MRPRRSCPGVGLSPSTSADFDLVTNRDEAMTRSIHLRIGLCVSFLAITADTPEGRMTHSRVRSSVVAFAAALTLGARCDLLVDASQTVRLTGREQVVGFETPNAVQVRGGGTLIVEDAELLGRDVGVRAIPEGPFPAPGAAIEAAGGTVRILAGRIQGGNVDVQVDPNTFP